ncbi:hypothetical protein FRC02_007747 [Tulasnella sp. 418]|nr:hypothetical protein FRC02_007747 [Tulasnella sp. 418]
MQNFMVCIQEVPKPTAPLSSSHRPVTGRARNPLLSSPGPSDPKVMERKMKLAKRIQMERDKYLAEQIQEAEEEAARRSKMPPPISGISITELLRSKGKEREPGNRMVSGALTTWREKTPFEAEQDQGTARKPAETTHQNVDSTRRVSSYAPPGGYLGRMFDDYRLPPYESVKGDKTHVKSGSDSTPSRRPRKIRKIEIKQEIEEDSPRRPLRPPPPPSLVPSSTTYGPISSPSLPSSPSWTSDSPPSPPTSSSSSSSLWQTRK